jgi:DNA-binding response OmpR family regulator
LAERGPATGSPASTGSEARKPETASRSRILIVDDEDAFRGLLRLRLEENFDIIDTGHAAEALALALQHKPDAILLDLSMPEFSGFELCQTLSSLSHTQSIPVFVVSGEPAGKYKTFCQNLGAREYVQKPVDFEDLQALLAATLKDKRRRRRPEVCVRLRVVLRLIGTDTNEKRFDVLTATEEVTPSGFSSGCTAPLKKDATVEVFLVGSTEQRVGQARATCVDWHDTPFPRYRFQFCGQPEQWFFQ